MSIAPALHSLMRNRCQAHFTISTIETLNVLANLPADSTAKESDYVQAVNYARHRKLIATNIGLNADTYAYILYKTGDYKKGYAYEKIAIANSGDKPDVTIIERYHQAMEKAGCRGGFFVDLYRKRTIRLGHGCAVQTPLYR